ncbi:MFS transporter, partial [Pseudoalteromonas maricaloris]
GVLAGNFDPENVDQMPNLYLQISLFCIGVGILVGLFGLRAKIWEGQSPQQTA